MNNRLETIKQIDQAINEITISLKKLSAIRDKEIDKIMTKVLNDYVLLVAYLNYQFMVYLMGITPESVKKDYIDTEFKKTMEGFFKNEK